MSYIDLKHGEKYYNRGKENEVHALKDVSISLEKGEMLALMGVSGSGKSTLLHCMGLMDFLDAGEYCFDGIAINNLNARKMADWRNKRIGFVLQSYGLLLHQTVAQNVSLPLLLNRDFPYRKIGGRVDDVLEMLSISDKKDTTIDMLSGGQMQRAAIARAIINSPDLLLADEPTSALDSRTAGEVMRIFQMLNRQYGTTIILATHDAYAAGYCDRIKEIADGKIRKKE